MRERERENAKGAVKISGKVERAGNGSKKG